VAFLWIGVAIIQFGGIFNMAALAASENRSARELIVSAAFPGGRLISSGFIGLAVFSAACLGSSARTGSPTRLGLKAILLFSLLYLAVVPILTSGRINFFVAAIGAYVAAAMAAQRLIAFRYAMAGILALAVSWTAKQYFSLGHISDASATDQAVEGLLFYFYNDILNALNPIGNMDGNYTLGWYSARFVFFLTFTNEIFRKAIAENLAHVGNWMTAGEVPFLAAPYVDFGVLGLVVIFLAGYFCKRAYHRANRQIHYLAIYGLCFATIVMSIHNSYLTSQEIVYNIILVAWVSRFVRKRKQRTRRMHLRQPAG
jgi:hypothetical protein